jgi:hypothetical protein
MVNPPAPFTHYKGTLLYHTLLLFRYANHDLDKLTLIYFGTIPLLPKHGYLGLERHPSQS